jgi:hypothetical protein
MKWPWVSRSSHETMVDLLTAQVHELKQECKAAA